jgi:hypothetical protein
LYTPTCLIDKESGRQTKSLHIMETVQYTAYIFHITATCFGYVDVAIIRLYTELYKENYLHKSCERDLGLTKNVVCVKYILCVCRKAVVKIRVFRCPETFLVKVDTGVAIV